MNRWVFLTIFLASIIGVNADASTFSQTFSGKRKILIINADGSVEKKSVDVQVEHEYERMNNGKIKPEFRSITTVNGKKSIGVTQNARALKGPIKGYKMELWSEKSGEPDQLLGHIEVYGAPGNWTGMNQTGIQVNNSGELFVTGGSNYWTDAKGKQNWIRNRGIVDENGVLKEHQHDELVED